MRHLPADLRQTARLLRRQPGLAITAIVALAMGIGFTTSMFAIVHGGTRALPFDQPHEVVLLTETSGRGGDAPIRPYTFRQWQASLTSFEGLGAWRNDTLNVAGSGDPDRLDGAAITPITLALLGERVALGRPFTDADATPGAPPVALIGDIVWRTRFGADPSVLGRTIRLDGVPHTIVGVMPRRFGFPINARIWIPLGVEAGAGPGAGEPLQVFGRLKDSASRDRAEAEAALEMARLASTFPATYLNHGARVLDFVELETPREIQRGLQVLVVAVSLAFLVACANVANLLLARAAARTRDTALRTALGASRSRLIGQALAEAVVLSGVACVLGVTMASIGLRFFGAATSGILEAFWVDFRIDATVVTFATSLAVLASLATALLPALRATAGGTNALLQAQAPGVAGLRIGRLGRALVIVQIALACGLFVLTATFVRAAASVRSVDLVFPARDILTSTLSVPGAIAADADARRRLLFDLKTRLDATPGLRQTAFTSVLPGRGGGNMRVAMADQPAGPGSPLLTAGVAMVTPEFFDLAGARASRGRLLIWQDDRRAEQVAVVNESLVRKLSPGRDVVGRRIRVEDHEFAVVGVVGDLLMQDVQDRDGSGVYLSMLQVRPFVIRTMTAAAAPPLDAFPAFRAAVHAVDPELPVLEPASLYDAIYADKQVLDAMATLFLAFGLGTVFLAVIGLFALLSFAVTARTREFGVRMALGAAPRDLVSLVFSRGARELAWGLGLGLPIAIVISRALAATLENVPAAGVGVFAAIVATVSAGAAVAMWRPLRRVARLAPVEAIREQ